MRKPFSTQARLDCATIGEVQLNLKCRDEIVPVLAGFRQKGPTDRVALLKSWIAGTGVAVGEEAFELDEAGFDLFAPLVELVCFFAETFVFGD